MTKLIFFIFIFYLFLCCCEFYLPALVGHTAALVDGPNHVISLGVVDVPTDRGRIALLSFFPLENQSLQKSNVHDLDRTPDYLLTTIKYF